MTQQIKSFEDACKALNIPATLPDFSAIPEKHRKALTAHYKLVTIAEALNEGWTPNGFEGEREYFPWFNTDDENAPLGFSFHDYGCAGAATGLGARLVFKTDDLARYTGTQFIDLYREYMMVEK